MMSARGTPTAMPVRTSPGGRGAQGRALCSLCGEPVPWLRKVTIHPDYYYIEGGCPACVRAYDLLVENGPRAAYHRGCLDDSLEKAYRSPEAGEEVRLEHGKGNRETPRGA